MKGLIFRELYLGRKNIFYNSLTWFVFVLIGILMRLSMLYGNLSDLPTADFAETEEFLYNCFTYLSVAVLMFSNYSLVKNIFSDFNTKWSFFEFSSPVNEYKYVGAKFLLTALFSAFTAIFSLINAAILCRLNGRAFDADAVLSIVGIVAFVMTVFFAYYALSYKLRSEKKGSIVLGLTIMVLYLIITAKILSVIEHIKTLYPNETDISPYMNEYTDACLENISTSITDVKQFLPIVFIALTAIFYFLSVKALKRREK